MAQCQINHRKSTRPWRFHKTTGGGPGALFFSSPMPEPEESPPRTPIGGHLPNCGLLERNAAGGMAPQPVGERSVNLAIIRGFDLAALLSEAGPASPGPWALWPPFFAFPLCFCVFNGKFRQYFRNFHYFLYRFQNYWAHSQ